MQFQHADVQFELCLTDICSLFMSPLVHRVTYRLRKRVLGAKLPSFVRQG